MGQRSVGLVPAARAELVAFDLAWVAQASPGPVQAQAPAQTRVPGWAENLWVARPAGLALVDLALVDPARADHLARSRVARPAEVASAAPVRAARTMRWPGVAA